MKFVALISGGKDSCYNILHCQKQNHELVALANLHPADKNEQELDSFMFQTVGHDIISLYEKCTGLPLFRKEIRPQGSKNVQLNYYPTLDDEIEDLYQLLKEVKHKIPDVEAVSVGAILSSYQRTRVEDVCGRLGLTVLSYLWQRSQLELMTEMCQMSKSEEELSDPSCCKLDARIIKVAAMGLDAKCLGKSLPQLFPTMLKLNEMYEVHICGEGGEFESMVLDAPFFRKGFLKLLEVVDVSDSNNSDGVFNAKLVVQFEGREVPEESFLKELDRLPVPNTLDPMWKELYDSISDIKPINNIPAELARVNEPVIKVSVHDLADKLYISNLQSNQDILSIKEQSRDIFAKLNDILQHYSLPRCNVLYASLILKDMGDFAIVNEEYNKFFNIWKQGPLPPSRACIESNLLSGNIKIQLSVVVNKSTKDIKEVITKNIQNENIKMIINTDKNGLHVQGRSYWAPCNIGPYSQSTWLNSDHNRITYLSGQIALQPASMEMCSSELIHLQSVLALRHLNSVKDAINSKRQLALTCFTSDDSMVPIISATWVKFAEDMIYESELEAWNMKDADPINCLIIVKVSKLPRNALCEWGGISVDEMTIEDPDNDDDDDQLVVTKRGDFRNVLDYKKRSNKSFGTLFANTIDEITEFIKNCNNAHSTLFHSKTIDNQDFGSVECIPVEAVYDYEGKLYNYGLHIVVTEQI
ncbi:diphthine--ammonia ligase RNJ42_00689 [Nakaseomyces bracarensis]|uniref:diphthine--ammonia ligase n=1 Tax=Nakaseomyces bracarensis TaxID=273131 RepID=UPI0038719195